MARLFFLFALCISVSAYAQDTKPLADVTIGDVIAGLEKQEAAMQTISVTLKAKKINSFGLIFGGGSRVRKSFTEMWHINTSSIGWNHATGTRLQTDKDGQRKSHDFEHNAAFDGDLGTSLTTEEATTGVKRKSGSVGKAFMRYGISPIDFTIGHQKDLISENLKSDQPRIVGTQEWEGREVLLIETLHSSKDSFFKVRYWVDPARDFTIVRRQNLSKENANDPWLAHLSIDSKKHKKHSDGLWLPTVVESRSLVAAKEKGGEPRVLDHTDIVCSDWKTNEPIDTERLRIKFPRGLRVHGSEQFAIETEKDDASGFFVQKIETPLQQFLIGSQNATVYAVVAATSFADVNTRTIKPADFDTRGFTNQLKQACEGELNPNLKMLIEFGELGTADKLGLFISEPLKSIARTAGFKQVRPSHRYGGDGTEFIGLDDLPDTSDEADLGNDDWHIYVVGTKLGRYLAGDADVLIQSKKNIALDTEELLTTDAANEIAAALKGHDVQGKKLDIRFVLGDKNTDPDDAEKLDVTKQSSDIQLNAVNKLRRLGFGDIVLKVTVSYRTQVSGYKQ